MGNNQKDVLFGKTLSQLEAIVKELGMQKYTAKQIASWLYRHHVESIEQMNNLSKANRDKLSALFDIGISNPVRIQTSVDGTKKYLFRSLNGSFIEAAYIPDNHRSTLCISSQAGCRFGCMFCMTGKQGFQGQLSAGDILNQVRSIPEREQISNIVYMGMGEPFDNPEPVMQSIELLTSDYGYGMSPRRITVSTIGIIPAMEVFLEQSSCHLAVSLHSPFEEERKRIMPVENAHSLAEVLNTIKSFSIDRQRRISFEYIVFKDLNHSERHVKALAKILNGIRCRINLLRYHPVPGIEFESPSDEVMERFKEALEGKGIITTIRRSRGQDISAACGLLSTKEYRST